MKTKIVFILIAVCMQTANLFSQEYEYVPFPKSNVIWSEKYNFGEIFPEYPPPAYERFTLTGEDTIINGKTYTKLYMFVDAIFDKNNAICVGGIREDENKKVYYKGNEIHRDKPFFYWNESIDSELMLYDFSLGVKDTLKIGGNVIDIISSIDTIQIGNSYRKRFKFKYATYQTDWIEGVGEIGGGLLYSNRNLTTGGQSNELICFTQNDETLYLNEYYDDCFPITGIKDIKKGEYQIIITQTTDGNIQFDFGEQIISSIQIYNSTGYLQNQVEKAGLNHLILSAKEFPQGIYLYRAISKEGGIYAGKFIVK
jgi:hypothetical protein